jgi:hypothetical protein
MKGSWPPRVAGKVCGARDTCEREKDGHKEVDFGRRFKWQVPSHEKIPAIGYTRGVAMPRYYFHMKLRKRDKIVVLFWVPFWTLTAAFVAGIGWAVGFVRLH